MWDSDIIVYCVSLGLCNMYNNSNMVIKSFVSIVSLILGCSSLYSMKEEKLNLLVNDQGNTQYWEPGTFPLVILVPDSVSEFMYNKVLQAAEEINLEANCIVFDVERRLDLDIVFSGFYQYYEYGKVVFKVQKIPYNRLAETEVFLEIGDLGYQGVVRAAEVRVSPDFGLVGIHQVIKHELLHTLQLGHDLNKNSIMYEKVHVSKYEIEKIDLNHIRNTCNGLMSFDLDSHI